MVRVTVIAVLCFWLAAIGARAQEGTTASSDGAVAVTFDSAKDLAGKGRLDLAMAQLDQLAARSPEPAGVERLRGIIFYQRGRFPDAIAAFAKAAEQDPNDHESVEMQGVSLFRLGRIQEALPLLEKARTGVQATNVDPNYVLALCYADMQRYDDARRAFASQYGFEPESAEAHLVTGRLFLRRELRDQAGGEATKALAVNPSIPLAHELLGEVALAGGDALGAIREFEAER